MKIVTFVTLIFLHENEQWITMFMRYSTKTLVTLYFIIVSVILEQLLVSFPSNEYTLIRSMIAFVTIILVDMYVSFYYAINLVKT